MFKKIYDKRTNGLVLIEFKCYKGCGCEEKESKTKIYSCWNLYTKFVEFKVRN